MDEVRLNTPSIVKLGSFAGKIKYCLIDASSIPLLKLFKLKITDALAQLIVVASDGFDDIPLQDVIWEYHYQQLIPADCTIHHRNGIPMDNRLENLLLLSNNTRYRPMRSLALTSAYWSIVANLPVDMDEVDYHGPASHQSSLYECHNAPCTQLLVDPSDEQFICPTCRKIKYCSDMCRTMDADIHSIFCNPTSVPPKS